MSSRIGADPAALQARSAGGNGPPAAARLLVTVATYNEAGNLSQLLPEVLAIVPHAHVLVIDDNSPDGTGKLADTFAATDPRVRVLHRPGKLGLGTALLAAMRYAMEHGYDLMLNLDADFSHRPQDIPAILAGMNRKDVMIGSRYIRGGGSEGWPFFRLFMSRSVNLLVRLMLRIPAADCSGAFRCYRVSMLRRTRLDKIISRGYSFQQEVLYRCRLAGCRLGETPIVFENRRAGKSKVNPKEAARSFLTIVYLGVRALLGVERQASRRPAVQT
jgi:dolichol-phosphate mannosyltransferase